MVEEWILQSFDLISFTSISNMKLKEKLIGYIDFNQLSEKAKNITEAHISKDIDNKQIKIVYLMQQNFKYVQQNINDVFR